MCYIFSRTQTPPQYDFLLPTTTFPLQQYDLLLDHASTVWPTVEYNHLPLQQYDLLLYHNSKVRPILLNTTTYPLQQYDLLLDHASTVRPIPTSAI